MGKTAVSNPQVLTNAQFLFGSSDGGESSLNKGLLAIFFVGKMAMQLVRKLQEIHQNNWGFLWPKDFQLKVRYVI